MKNIVVLIALLAAGVAFIYWNQSTEPTAELSEQASATEVENILEPSPASSDARVFFVSPQDGETVASPVSVVFGIEGMSIQPAGINEEFSGHHHILVNVNELPDLTKPLPATDSIIHFGKGQTETQLELPAGTHTLQLVLGNYLHIPHSPPVMSEKITITVE